jgi:hypothetical protein
MVFMLLCSSERLLVHLEEESQKPIITKPDPLNHAFRLIGFSWNGNGILLTSPLQSRKLVAVWTRLEPLPLIALELCFWATIALAEGFAIAAVMEWGKKRGV